MQERKRPTGRKSGETRGRKRTGPDARTIRDLRQALLKHDTSLTLAWLVIRGMREKRISIRTLCAMTGVTPNIIQDVRAGKRENIRLNTLIRLLAGLDATLCIQHKGELLTLSKPVSTHNDYLDKRARNLPTSPSIHARK